jgi:hypothetical protein
VKLSAVVSALIVLPTTALTPSTASHLPHAILSVTSALTPRPTHPITSVLFLAVAATVVGAVVFSVSFVAVVKLRVPQRLLLHLVRLSSPAHPLCAVVAATTVVVSIGTLEWSYLRNSAAKAAVLADIAAVGVPSVAASGISTVMSITEALTWLSAGMVLSTLWFAARQVRGGVERPLATVTTRSDAPVVAAGTSKTRWNDFVWSSFPVMCVS